jgi:hypothetical protein
MGKGKMLCNFLSGAVCACFIAFAKGVALPVLLVCRGQPGEWPLVFIKDTMLSRMIFLGFGCLCCVSYTLLAY